MIKIKTDIPNIDNLSNYNDIPSKYYASHRYEVHHINGGLGGIKLVKNTIKEPYWLDYDYGNTEGHERYAKKWDLKNWHLITAYDDNRFVGTALLAHDTDGVNRLKGMNDITCLWGIRVHPDYQRKGIGSALVKKAIEISKNKNCRYMNIETQNTNVTACNFYVAQGAVLGGFHLDPYANNAHEEIMLDWYIYL